jgi:hypothetical protein
MIGLIVFVFGAVGIINTVFQNYVFQVDYDSYYPTTYPMVKSGTCGQAYTDYADTTGKTMIVPTPADIAECEINTEKQKEQNKRNRIGQELSIALAQIAVGLPLWLFHWGIIQSEAKRREEKDS